MQNKPAQHETCCATFGRWQRPLRSARSPAIAAGALLGAAALAATALAAAPASAAGTASQGTARAAAAVTVGCTSKSNPALAARLARDIAAARNARSDSVALVLDAPFSGVSCSLSGAAQFDSASVVKVTILGALLRKAMDQNRYLTSRESTLARAMITQSDNNAASALWTQLGRSYIQHFLTLAGMTQTVLGPGGYWGLTQITARDETRLLDRLLQPNAVLNNASRAYARTLMSQVIASQRWGVTAGTPVGVMWHVKNGWLSRTTHGWRIHSIGFFTTSKSWYTIVVLTQNNSTMAYGVTTIQNIARVIHRDLNPGVKVAFAPVAPSSSWVTPDEKLPALSNIP